MDKAELGKILKEKRENLNYSQTTCAIKCGVCLETYQKWERGLSFPKPDKYDRLRDCLGVDVDGN